MPAPSWATKILSSQVGDLGKAKRPLSRAIRTKGATQKASPLRLDRGRTGIDATSALIGLTNETGNPLPTSALNTDFLGSASTSPEKRFCPTSMVPIGQSYCIDAYEAALLQMLPDGSEQSWSPYHQLREGIKVRAITGPGLVPQGYISGKEAAASCKQSGKRLCKPEEWQKACMGPKRTLFPYGAERQANKCNDHGRSSMQFYNQGLTDRPEDSWKWGANGNMLDPRLNALEGTLAKTGEHPECTNEYGVFDMVGNLHEWVDDPWGTFNGGYYLDTHLNGDGCAYRTTAHDMSHKDYSTGFRCCADMSDE